MTGHDMASCGNLSGYTCLGDTPTSASKRSHFIKAVIAAIASSLLAHNVAAGTYPAEQY